MTERVRHRYTRPSSLPTHHKGLVTQTPSPHTQTRELSRTGQRRKDRSTMRAFAHSKSTEHHSLRLRPPHPPETVAVTHHLSSYAHADNIHYVKLAAANRACTQRGGGGGAKSHQVHSFYRAVVQRWVRSPDGGDLALLSYGVEVEALMENVVPLGIEDPNEKVIWVLQQVGCLRFTRAEGRDLIERILAARGASS